MNTMQMINKFFMHNFETTCRKQIEDTWGERIRPVKNTSNVEISTTYFYSNQNHTKRVVDDFTKFATANGFTVTVKSDYIRFATNPWPKQSWATMTVEVTAA